MLTSLQKIEDPVTSYRSKQTYREHTSNYVTELERKIAAYEAAAAQRESRYQSIEENLRRENKALRSLLGLIGKSQVISESLHAERGTKECPQNERAWHRV
jgi:hypothetical protein